MKITVRHAGFTVAAAGAILALGATTASAMTIKAPADRAAVQAPAAHVATAAPARPDAPLSASAARAARNAINAWENTQGNTDLGNAATALGNSDWAALAKWAALSAKSPEPFETSRYVTFMHEFAIAGTELAHGQASAGRAEIKLATKNAVAYNQDVAGIVARVSITS